MGCWREVRQALPDGAVEGGRELGGLGERGSPQRNFRHFPFGFIHRNRPPEFKLQGLSCTIVFQNGCTYIFLSS